MNIQMVCHGEAEARNGLLTVRGERQAEYARDTLIKRGLGKNAVILSSEVYRSVATALTIATGVGAQTVFSTRLGLAGENPHIFRSLERLLNHELSAQLSDDYTEATRDGLIVITHPAMMSVAKGFDPNEKQAAFGEVIEYDTNQWPTTMHRPLVERILCTQAELPLINV